MEFEITTAEVKDMLRRGIDLLLIDVREPFEHSARNIPQAVLIPMAEVPGRLDEINSGRTVVVHCTSGARSAAVCKFLRRRGVQNVFSMAGGLNAW
ncbi:MAG: rhodanese-like domain-containing protein [Acidobacteria bacterium]|nr:rhodanese-like domain-containing protein [Acidobacteriota bacterium]